MLNVLIVEDDLSIADLLQTALKLEGYGVTGIARTVREAIESVAEQRPDFAVIDLRLAHGDLGTDVGVHLRKIKVNPGILYSTGNSNEIMLTRAHGDAVMIKPYLMRDVGRGLTIIGQLARSGETDLAFPRSFRLLNLDSSLD